MSPSNSDASVSIERTRTILRCGIGIGIVGLLAAYAVTQVARHQFGLWLGGERGLVQLFDLRVESNIPSVFSTLLFALAAAALFVVAAQQRHRLSRDWQRWLILGAIMLALAFDEGGEVHERLSFLIWRFVKTEGVLHDAWLIPYAVLVMVAAVYFWPFVRRLPAGVRNRYILAGALFVGSAFGMEMVEGYYETHHGTWTDGRYAILVGIEEVGEMLGLTIFIDTTLFHLQHGLGVRAVRFESV